jgi:thiol:disulfide interchange protein DsbD
MDPMKLNSRLRQAGLVLAGLISIFAASAHADPGDGIHVQAQLVADHTAIAPGGTIHLALVQTIAPGWHTYWRNPGDSGEAT